MAVLGIGTMSRDKQWSTHIVNIDSDSSPEFAQNNIAFLDTSIGLGARALHFCGYELQGSWLQLQG